MLKKHITGALTRRNLKVALMVAVVPISVAVGYYGPQAYDAVTMGKSASSIAGKLGCTGFRGENAHTPLYVYRDAGICNFHGASVRIITFDRMADGSAYDQTLKVVEARNAKAKGGVYAAGPGWNVVDANAFTATVAEAVVAKLGGSTYDIPTVTRKTAATPSPSAAASPSASARP
jgi:hypothetical protein